MKSVLNVGGGSKEIPIPSHYAGWTHVLLDIDPRAKPDVCMDARNLLTLPAATYDAVYCSHNLEHFYRHDGLKVMAGFHHVLKDDGFAEIIVPNLEAVFAEVAAKKMDIDDALYVSPAGPIVVHDVLYGYQKQIASSGDDFYAHKTGFTRKSFVKFVANQGWHSCAIRDLHPFALWFYLFKRPANEEQQAMLRTPWSLAQPQT